MDDPDAAAPSALPEGLKHAYHFSFLNAVAFQIAAGAPLVLYAKSLGASATVLGVLASMMPMLSVFQLPAAQFLPRYGYRRFIMAGWGLRSVMIFALAATTLLPLDATSKLCLVLAEIFLFCLMRGISSGAWMPWITELVPEHGRGRYLSREQLSMYAGSVAALGFSALTMAWLPDPWRYLVIFLLSASAGVVSVNSIRQIPDVEAPEKLRSSAHPVPWLAILQHPPFQRLVIFNLLWVSTAAGVPIFTVAWLRDMAGFSESHILWLSLAGFAGAIGSLPFLARILDGTGSKPVLRTTTLLAALVLIGWTGLSCGLVPATAGVVAGLYLLFGLANANFAVANARLSMATMPVMGRNHFFALYTVITSLLTGLAPIFWGMLIDALHGLQWQVGRLIVGHFTVYFAISTLLMAFTTLTVTILVEAHPSPLSSRDFAILGAIKRLSRLWQK